MSKFKAGDKVRIVRKGPEEYGRFLCWVAQMDRLVANGKVYEVRSPNWDGGVKLNDDAEVHGLKVAWPEESLELAEATDDLMRTEEDDEEDSLVSPEPDYADEIAELKAIWGITMGSPYDGKRIRYTGPPEAGVITGDLGIVLFQDDEGDLCVLLDRDKGKPELHTTGFAPDEVEVVGR